MKVSGWRWWKFTQETEFVLSLSFIVFCEPITGLNRFKPVRTLSRVVSSDSSFICCCCLNRSELVWTGPNRSELWVVLFLQFLLRFLLSSKPVWTGLNWSKPVVAESRVVSSDSCCVSCCLNWFKPVWTGRSFESYCFSDSCCACCCRPNRS